MIRAMNFGSKSGKQDEHHDNIQKIVLIHARE